jgi:hypothetical protein
LKIDEIKKNHQIDYNSLNSTFKGRIIKRNEIPFLVNRVEGKENNKLKRCVSNASDYMIRMG